MSAWEAATKVCCLRVQIERQFVSATMNAAAFAPTQVLDTLHSWCTPTVLFLLLNLVIATIAFTSLFLNNNNNNNNPNAIRRNPSLLTRLSSLNFSRKSYEQAEMVTWTEPQPQPQPQKGVAEDHVAVEQVTKQEQKTVAENRRPPRAGQDGASGLLQRKSGGPARSKSDTTQRLDLHPPPPPLPGKITKSETFELTVSHARAATPPPPPPPQYGEEEARADAPYTDEVNAKADDFINKFKQQLKLQRLESLMRYKENLNAKK